VICTFYILTSEFVKSDKLKQASKHTEEEILKVFLTGGTGFIGKHLARTLLDRGWSLTVPTRRPSSADAQTLQEMGTRGIEGEIALLERRKGQRFLARLKPLEGYITPP
jgi:nucleoside-diphosphate-sugar epimerase